MTRNILLLSYHFPPEQSGGVARPYSLYQHLPAHGYRPIVVTTTNDAAHRDPEIERYPSLVRGRGEGRLDRRLMFRIVNRLGKYLGGDPTSDMLWRRNVSAAGDGLIERHGIELIYATYPPVETLKLGLRLGRRHRLPLVVEFRDGLTFEPLAKYSALQRLRASSLEEELASHAAAIVTIGENISSYFRENYANRRVFTVYNGYDKAEQLVSDEHKRPDTVARFVHFGSLNLSKKRNVTPLFGGIAQLKMASAQLGGRRFVVTFIGKYSKEERDLVEHLRISDVVRLQEPVSKSDGLRDIRANYDYLLFYGVPGESTFISAKLMEYISLEKPILGVCKGNEAEHIIRQTGTGEVCDFGERDIFELFLKFALGEVTYKPDRQRIAAFDRAAQAGEIARILDTVLSEAGRPGPALA